MAQMRDEVLHDVRLTERHVRKGVLNRKDLDKRLKDLPDMTEQSEILSLNEDGEIVARPNTGNSGS